jgi:hypothetical protein
MALSTGSRSFTRYGYADLLRDDRKYTVRHRVWAGTERLLLWGDARYAASYSRALSFCGSTGADVMEPLTFMGRRGTGTAGSRCGYADASLNPKWDWQKYEYWYRIWGRSLYNPETDPDGWRRLLRQQGSGDASAVETALANASRILPTLTTAHLPSAACDTFWPELYWNHSMVDARQRNPYSDTPAPKTFQNVSPLDPQLFSRMSDFADELLKGERTGKYSPLEVAQWLDDFAEAAEKGLAGAGKLETFPALRVKADIAIQAGLGRFFAAKFRAGVLYSIFEKTGDIAALQEALKAYRVARAQWALTAERAKGVYVTNLSAGDRYSVRGHWSDRLALIDDDIAQMAQKSSSAKMVEEPRVRTAVMEALVRPIRDRAACRHQPPARFRPKEAVALEIVVPERKVASVRIYYRHVDQAERFESVEMEARGEAYHASIPAAYTDSPFALQYYFEVKESHAKAWLWPGFAADLANQPYFVVRRG